MGADSIGDVAVRSRFSSQTKGKEMSASTQELASRWKRLGGAMLDGLIIGVIAVPAVLVQVSRGQLSIDKDDFFIFFIDLAFFLALNGYLLAKNGQTLGKMLIGTRIVSNDDERILPFGRVVGLRFLPFFLMAHFPVSCLASLLEVLFIFRKDKRCLHDLIAGSKVVNTQRVQGKGARWAIGMLLAAYIIGIAGFLGFIVKDVREVNSNVRAILESNTEAMIILGSPIYMHWEANHENTYFPLLTEKFNFSYLVNGSKTDGTVHGAAIKDHGAWKIERIELTINSNGKRIDLSHKGQKQQLLQAVGASITSEGKIAENDQTVESPEGFTITIPKGYTYSKSAATSLVSLVAIDDANGSATPTISVLVSSLDVDLERFVDKVKSGVIAENQTTRFSDIQVVEAGRHKLYRIPMSYQRNGGLAKGGLVYFEKDNKVFILTYGTLDELYSKNEPVFEKIIHSFGPTDTVAAPAAKAPASVTPAIAPTLVAPAPDPVVVAAPAVASPIQPDHPLSIRSDSVKTATTRPMRHELSDLRGCLELRSNYAIAKCAGNP